MKRLVFMAILALAFSGSAGATDTATVPTSRYCLGVVPPDLPVYRIRPGCFVEGPSQELIPHDGKLVIGTGIPANCLATMETAMRAMEEFVPTRPSTTTGALSVYDHCLMDTVCMAKRHLATAERQQAAIMKWEASKTCWGRP